ncbi:hypothetical protein Q8F55_006750 [Vanrija albida]|uniref:Zn(2)-C6 fungal-type domain-containing protein n=1 Tax=Vanrija albida TaxID=181172 RepID=A0ABR3PYY6_9TREE
MADSMHDSSSSAASDSAEARSRPDPIRQPSDMDSVPTTAPKKVDVSHFPHYGLKRGMACTFCRRRKLRCSGDRPTCTNCIKYTKVCEYGPPVKEPKPNNSRQNSQQTSGSSSVPRYSVPGPDVLMPQVMPIQQHGPSGIPTQSGVYNQTVPQQYNYLMPTTTQSDGLGIAGMGAGFQSPMFQQQSQFVPMMTTPGMMPFGTANASFTGAQGWLGGDGIVQPQPYDASPHFHQGVLTSEPYDMAQGSLSAQQQQQPLPTSASISQLPSDTSTPEQVLTSQSTDSSTHGGGGSAKISSLFRQNASLHYVSDVQSVEGLTERLGEFLFSPNASAISEEEASKRRKQSSGHSSKDMPVTPGSLSRLRTEYDGLQDVTRTVLLDCFLEHATLFFEMSIPRFRYRMTFADRRRPNQALLNAMYLWATRISNSPQMVNMEKHFFEQSVKALDSSTSSVDRLIDSVRAAMLLAAYSHSSGRHHEGWCLAGLATRLVLSCGLHRIPSCVHRPEPPKNPFLRNRFFLLPPPDDAVELGERIHAFWAVFAIDRCGALATGYSAGIRDEDITTPFGRHLVDIASGNVTERDDVTVRDLYKGTASGAENDTHYTKWVKCVAILERSAKLVFLEPEEDSPYALAWNQYSLTVHRDPGQSKPPEYLNQPKYRNPRHYRECLLAVEQLVGQIGDEGVFPVYRLLHAEQDGMDQPNIPSNIVMLHHLITAVHMVLHDINSLGVENTEALRAARKSVQLFRSLPKLPFTDVDAFVVLVWSMISKVLIKEIHRLSLAGDHEAAHNVGLDADTVVEEISRIGETMYLARTQARAIEELKLAAFAAGNKDANNPPLAMPQLESFMFPQHM